MEKKIKISSLQISILTFFLSQVTFFPFASTLLFKTSKQDIWISIILGIVLGFMIIKLFLYIQNKKKEKTLFEYLVSKFGSIFGNIFNILICLIVLFVVTLIFSKFCVFLNFSLLFLISMCYNTFYT